MSESNGHRPQDPEQLLARGLWGRWYAVYPSRLVAPGDLLRLTRLDRNWVLFREPGGALHMLEDRCPHRGAALSLGQHLGDRISCQYHGVQVDGSGTVVSVPGMPGCALEGRRLVHSLPLHEEAGAIFAYFGDPEKTDPPPFELADRLADSEVSHFLNYAEWNAPWRYYLDNILDPMHGAFLHRQSHSMSGGDTSARFRIRETDRGFVFEKTDQRGLNFDWVEYVHGHIDWFDLEIPYPPTAGPGGPFGIVGTVVPVTATSCAVFHWRCRRVQDWEREVWRFLYRLTLESRHWAVLEQDRAMLEDMPADADARENLYQHDLGLARLRRLFKAEAERQATAHV
jgi:phenylpropionate dioxygenase-like ring-hydroxylating dioxygenase large terminal subunit